MTRKIPRPEGEVADGPVMCRCSTRKLTNHVEGKDVYRASHGVLRGQEKGRV